MESSNRLSQTGTYKPPPLLQDSGFLDCGVSQRDSTVLDSPESRNVSFNIKSPFFSNSTPKSNLNHKARSDYRKTYDHVTSLKPREYRPRRDYKTLNRFENQDNDYDNPEWDDWKNARTDTDRKKLAMRKFGNPEPADPDRCLNFHGFRRRQNAIQKGFQAHQASVSTRQTNRIRIRDGKIEFLDQNRNKIEIGKRKAEDYDGHPSAKRPKSMSFSDYEDEMIQILTKYKRQVFDDYDGVVRYGNSRSADKEWKYFMSHFKASIDEAKNFAEYYQGTSNLEISQKVLDRCESTEFLFNRFATFYEPNKRVHCKECSEMENRKVNHRV